MKYYTLQITFGNFEKPEVIEFKDLHPDPSQSIADWIRQTREKLFTTGFQRQTSPGAWEMISPLMVYKALLLLQDKKYGV